MNDVAAILVTYNSADVIAAAIESCLPVCKEIIVVDNASMDGTVAVVQRYPTVKLIASERNLGFAGGVNRGIAAAQCELVLLLNPDAAIEAGLAEMAELCSREGVGIVGGRLVDPDGTFQRGFAFRRLPTAASLALEVLGLNRLFPTNPVNRSYRCLDSDPGVTQQVEQPAGAFLLTRRSVWTQAGGLDEAFHPVWYEDVDYCKRVLELGFSIWYLPQAVARHQGGHSAVQLDWGAREVYWYASLLVYARKHLTRRGHQSVCVAVMGGCLARLAVQLVHQRSAEPFRIYGKVLRLAWTLFSQGDSRPRQ
jgi:GT2 family glycosyltransferase